MKSTIEIKNHTQIDDCNDDVDFGDRPVPGRWKVSEKMSANICQVSQPQL